MESNNATEQKILDAAEMVFIEEGLSGARMQQIADRAGINKAMLHYYFRSKDKLFQLIFVQKMGEFIPKVEAALQEKDKTAIEKMDIFVDAYLHMLRRNPRLPMFILATLNRNPEFAKAIKVPVGKKVVALLEEEMNKGNIKRVDPYQFMLTVIGMCIFPFVARPIFSQAFGVEKENYDHMLQERHQHVKQYIRAIMEKN
jgi:TetR/AcrR family transcriptional regulator